MLHSHASFASLHFVQYKKPRRLLTQPKRKEPKSTTGSWKKHAHVLNGESETGERLFKRGRRRLREREELESLQESAEILPRGLRSQPPTPPVGLGEDHDAGDRDADHDPRLGARHMSFQHLQWP